MLANYRLLFISRQKRIILLYAFHVVCGAETVIIIIIIIVVDKIIFCILFSDSCIFKSEKIKIKTNHLFRYRI